MTHSGSVSKRVGRQWLVPGTAEPETTTPPIRYFKEAPHGVQPAAAVRRRPDTAHELAEDGATLAPSQKAGSTWARERGGGW